jgi:phenylpropionate dioxygenase-like ring-hydroxylating dioxygenase large terminal subunit
VNFEIEPDIARARTLDAAFYRSAEVFGAVRERVFARSWQWLGRVDDVAVPESYAPRDLLPGLLDEPLLLARDEAGELRCLSNVCTHRGNVVVTEAGRDSQLRCRYHGRRFGLDGRLRSMPAFEGVRDFPGPCDDLPRVDFGSWAGHAFASVAPAAPLDVLLAAMRRRIGWLAVESFAADPARSRDYEFDANWALYVENYLEGLHIAFVHPGLTRTLRMAAYDYELGSESVLQIAAARAGEPAFDPPAGSPEHGSKVAAYYFWLFPNTMFNFYPWGLSVNVVVPLAPARTKVLFRSFVGDASLIGSGAGGALDPVEMEDEAVVLGVQRGIGSRLYRGGRYSPKHELGAHHFHRLLAQALIGHVAAADAAAGQPD